MVIFLPFMASEGSGGFNPLQPITTGNDPASAGVLGNPGQSPQKNKKWVMWIILFFLLSLAGGGVFWFLNDRQKGVQPAAETPVAVSTEEQKSPVLAETQPVTPAPVPLFGDANYRSENYRVGDIAIGGEAEFFLSEDNPAPLEITDVREDAFTEKNKQEVRLVLSWHTNKLSKADVEYSKGVGQAVKISSEDDFSLNHSMVIFGLDQASTYVYTIKSQDRFGNKQKSDPHAVYTGSRTVSLFDLIADAVGDVFGWAVKKK
jgi:hypothetical protein